MFSANMNVIPTSPREALDLLKLGHMIYRFRPNEVIFEVIQLDTGL